HCVEPNVLLVQIAGIGAGLAAAEAYIDRNEVFRLSHDLPNPLQADTIFQHPPLDQTLVSDRDRDLLLLAARRRLAERHHDASPVRVLPVDRGLDEWRVRDAARRE